MRRNRIRVLFAASLFIAAAGLAAASAFAAQPYDGLWQVTVVTKTGSCDAQTTSTLTVTRRQGFGRGRRRSPAASAAGVLCGSRSMVHMRTVNSVATPDRGSGMAHQRVSRAAVDGKLPGNKSFRLRTFGRARRLAFAAAAFFVTSTAIAHAQSGGPFAGMAGNWSGGGTVTLDDGSSERIRCRATYAVGAAATACP